MPVFPEIEPHRTGFLKVGDGQEIYWEESGNPLGIPALNLHGGPGSGSTPGGRRRWDPEKYRIIQLDQRNCGRSTPSAADLTTDLTENTTWALIEDIEQLRRHLDVQSWVLWGGSWGVTLALTYAQTHPERVRALVLISVTMTRRFDVHWLYHEAGRFFPEAWQDFKDGAAQLEAKLGYHASAEEDLVCRYYRLLNESQNPEVAAQAALQWCIWEDAVLSLEPGWAPNEVFRDPDFRLAFARIVTHYFHHGAWLKEGQILQDMHKIASIPGVLIHGRLDVGGPADVPWLIHQQWPASELHILPDLGHKGGPEVTSLMMEATNRFATHHN